MSHTSSLGRLYTTLLLSLTLSSSSLVVVQADSFPFYWYFDSQYDYTTPQCSVINFGMSLEMNSNSTRTAAPPYTLTVHSGGGIPQVFPADGLSPYSSWNWTVAYAVGSQLLFDFQDAKGQSGGVGALYNVVPRESNVTTNSSCVIYGQQTSPISFNLSNYSPQLCETVNVYVAGGTPPYTVQQVVAGDNFTNSTITRSDDGLFVNKVSAGGQFIVSLVDSKGIWANSTQLLASAGGNNGSCFAPTPPSGGGSRIWPYIVGGVIGGVGLIAALVVIWLFRRRIRRHKEELAAANSAVEAARNSSASGSSEKGELSPVGNGAVFDWRVATAASGANAQRPEMIALRDSSGTLRPGSSSRYPPASTGSETMVNPSFSPGKRSAMLQGMSAAGLGAAAAGVRWKQHNAQWNDSRSSLGEHGPHAHLSVEDHDNPWPTVRSSASSATEDHYGEVPASSAGILGRGNSTKGPLGRRGKNNTAENDEEDDDVEDGEDAEEIIETGAEESSPRQRSNSEASGASTSAHTPAQRLSHQWRQVQPEELESPMYEYDEEQVWTPTADSMYGDGEGATYMSARGARQRRSSHASQIPEGNEHNDDSGMLPSPNWHPGYTRPMDGPPTISMVMNESSLPTPASAGSQPPDSPFKNQRTAPTSPSSAMSPTTTAAGIALPLSAGSTGADDGQRTPMAGQFRSPWLQRSAEDDYQATSPVEPTGSSIPLLSDQHEEPSLNIKEEQRQ